MVENTEEQEERWRGYEEEWYAQTWDEDYEVDEEREWGRLAWDEEDLLTPLDRYVRKI